LQRYKVAPSLGRAAVVGSNSGDYPTSYINLGRLAEIGRRKEMVLDLDSEHVVAVVGKRGSGKTHTLGVIVEGLCSPSTGVKGIGASNPDSAVLIVDTLNLFQWLDNPLSEAHGNAVDVQKKVLTDWGLTEMPVNTIKWRLAGDGTAAPDERVLTLRPRDLDAQDWGRLIGSDIMAEPMGQLIADVHHRVKESGWSGDGQGRSPNADYSLEDLVACLQGDSSLQSDYSPETIRAVRQRLTAYSRINLFDTNGLELRDLVQSGTASVLLLGRVGEDLRALVVFLLIRLLLEERSKASEAIKDSELRGRSAPTGLVPKTWLVIDEAQNIFPARSHTTANDILTRYVREGRNFGLSLAITTQQPSALDTRVMAQVDTLIAHTLTVRPDVNYILNNLKSADPASVSLNGRDLKLGNSLMELDTGYCLVSAVDLGRSAFLEVRPRVTVHGGFER